MSNSTTLLDQILSNQAAKEVLANALFDAMSPASLWGRHASACSGLTWGYYGGCYVDGTGTLHTIANGTVALTASATNYLYADATTGAVSVGSSVPAGKVPLYNIVAGTTTVTSYTDCRSYQPSAVAASAIGVYDVGGYIEGTPSASETVFEFYSPRAWTLPSGASGGSKAGIAATGSTTFTLALNGTGIGTLTYAAAGTTGTLSVTSTTAIAAGDVLSLTAPATPDATLANIAFTLSGTRP